MELLEELLKCRDKYEQYDDTTLVRATLNNSIDEVITKGMPKRENKITRSD